MGETSMFTKKSLAFPLIFALVLVLVVSLATVAADPGLSDEEELGKFIFFDENLSINNNQSCASCHDPAWGWTGPDSDINAHGAVYEGSIAGRFGNRKPPSAAYATLSPIFHQDKSGLFVGGNFWDGRATGEKLGNPAADQAQGPFTNPVEQALPDSDEVVYRVCNAAYADLFKEVWGEDVCEPDNEEMAFGNIALSIAVYEDSSEVNAFTSKHDQTFSGKVKLDKQEQRGYALFRGKGMCHRCHISNGKEALFTDFTFDNLGVPKNPENPVYDVDPTFVDAGLGGFLESMEYPEEVYMAEWGKQKVPTLRNVDLRPDEDPVKAYAHNGYFKTLEGIVHFYNTRDVKDVCPGDYTEAEALAVNCWPAPEVAENVNSDELGDLGLTVDEEAAIVAFLKTLSDGFMP
jgi:cytochrome c peroxidase